MTETLCHADSYLREFDARVVKTTAKGVVLDRTAFYPGGGGQPSDTGVLRVGDRELRVRKISRSDGELVHETDGEPPPAGTDVSGAVDWERRYQLMRTHTALHILCGVVWRDFGAKVTGGDMKPLSARMDFELDQMSSDFATMMESLINREVGAARPVEIGVLSREEAFAIPDPIRTKINLLPPSIQEVRTVNLVGLDLQADGGTHVANTSEVGNIRVVGHESKGRINKRLRIEIDA
jgi:misacylated tRNA(Ala) deacylase